ncbi:hypothetical protein M8J76_010294 [Diaphorina citri]|nr:hypothetical protein M8J76_010294 [Diaphorina citri]
MGESINKLEEITMISNRNKQLPRTRTKRRKPQTMLKKHPVYTVHTSGKSIFFLMEKTDVRKLFFKTSQEGKRSKAEPRVERMKRPIDVVSESFNGDMKCKLHHEYPSILLSCVHLIASDTWCILLTSSPSPAISSR